MTASPEHTHKSPAEIVKALSDGSGLEWTVHPVKRRPLVSIAVSVFIVAVVALVRITTDSQAFAVLALVVMAASLAKFYFPTKYRLNENGVTVKTTTQTLVKEWKLYRSCYADKNGILLSPFAGTSRLENFRGIYLMFQDNSEAVTAYCKERIAANPQGEAV